MPVCRAVFVAALLLAVPVIAAAQSPALLVLNKEDATLAIVDPASGKVVGTVPTGEGPHEIATDGTLAFVGNYGGRTPGSTLSVIDIAARKERHRVDLGPLRRPHGIAVAGGKVYFTAETNRVVARYDPASNQVDWIIGTGQATTHMVQPSADGRTLFTANIGSDSISILEQGQNPLAWNVTSVPVGRGPEGFDVSPDGRELWAAHSRDGGVSIVDVAAKKVTQTIDLGTKRSNRLKFTPDGKHVLISDIDTGEVLVVDTASHRVVKRLAVGRSPEGILVVPDGSRAYLAVTGENRIDVLDLSSMTITGHIETGNGPDGMAWVR
ncbi:MAG TPA: YncE family protein [Vicinamibacterales bacterium]|nr:YncE family protein [Vicinamibacterales bacterium]